MLKLVRSEILQTEVRLLYELLYVLNNSYRGNKTFKALKQVSAVSGATVGVFVKSSGKLGARPPELRVTYRCSRQHVPPPAGPEPAVCSYLFPVHAARAAACRSQ